jgi:hypothetical protein
MSGRVRKARQLARLINFLNLEGGSGARGVQHEGWFLERRNGLSDEANILLIFPALLSLTLLSSGYLEMCFTFTCRDLENG